MKKIIMLATVGMLTVSSATGVFAEGTVEPLKMTKSTQSLIGGLSVGSLAGALVVLSFVAIVGSGGGSSNTTGTTD